MKKFLLIIAVIFAILIAAIVAIPVFFKDHIRKAIDDAMAENLNARVYYDTNDLSLSLIKSFPDLSVSIGNFGIVGVEEFEQDTLASIGNFLVTLDIMSIVSGNQIAVEKILLDKPNILIKVLPDGKANYDIAKASENASPEEENTSDEKGEESASEVSIGIKEWTISEGKVVYDDQSMQFNTTLLGLNHQGTGDFTLDVFDLKTNTTIDNASLGFEGVEYVSNKSLAADVTLNMNLGEMMFTFKENEIAVNKFAMQVDGFLSMPGEDINMDLSFGGKDISLKSILSLIPGVYQEYLDGVTASGAIDFDGYVKGTFNEKSMPKVAANLGVNNGSVRYEEVAIPIDEINIQTNFNYPSADLRETSFNVNKFSMLVDGEPVSAYLKFKNLENYHWDFGLDGNIDLQKITKVVPLEDMKLLGKINAQLKTSGKMSDLEAEKYDQLPTSGNVQVSDFLFESKDLPKPFSISKADLAFDPAEITLKEFYAKSGNSDFSLKGKVNNYLGFVLSENEKLVGQLAFNSNLIDVNEWIPEDSSEEGQSDETSENTEETEDNVTTEAVKIPENIDFTLASSIGKIAYANMPITNFQGKILVRDGAIILDKNTFNLLDGNFELLGSYVTKDLDNPKYDLQFKIKDLSISSAFESFETIQKYVPIAKQVSGRFSTDFKVNGLLGKDMMPISDAINLKGLVNVAQATLDKGTFVQKLSQVAALKTGAKTSEEKTKKISIKDVLINTKIENGRMYIEPFDLKVGGQQAVLGGNNGLDGSLDYSMLLKDVSTGQIGNALNSALSSLTGGSKLISDKININLGIGGTSENPSVKLLGTSNADGSEGGAGASVKQQLSSQVDEQKKKAEAELARKKEEAKAELARQKAAAEAKARKAAEELAAKKKAAEDSIRAAIEAKKKAAEEAAKSKIKGFFKKKGGGE